MKTPFQSSRTIRPVALAIALMAASAGFAACENQPDAPGCSCYNPTGAWAPTGPYIQDIALATDWTAESCPCADNLGCDWDPHPTDPNRNFKNGGKPYYQMVIGCNSELCAEFVSWALSYAGRIFHHRVEWCSETISYWHREAGIPYSQGFKTCGWHCDWQIYNVLDLRRWYVTEDFTTPMGGGGRGRWIRGEDVSYSDFRLGETVPVPGAYVAIRGYDYEPEGHWQDNDNYHSQMVNEMWVHEDALGTIFQVKISLVEGNSSNRVKSSNSYHDILSRTPQGSEWIGSDRKIYGFGIDLDSEREPIYDPARLHWEKHDYIAQPPITNAVQSRDLDWEKFGWNIPQLQAYAKQLEEEDGLSLTCSSDYVKVPELPDGNSIHWHFPKEIPEEVIIEIDLKAVHPLPIKGIELVWDPAYLPLGYMVQFADERHEFKNASMPDYSQIGLFKPQKGGAVKNEYPPIPVPAFFADPPEGTDVRYVRLVFPKDTFEADATLLGLRFQYYETPREDSPDDPGECFPSDYTTYDDWVAVGKPDCWCGHVFPRWRYQCDGDCDGYDETFFKYRVFGGDLECVVENWKKKAGDPTLNACADIDHKSETFFKYRVFGNDLGIVVRNWKKKDPELPDKCPRPE